ncbi:hypothetical protein BDV3_000550 [Batrachochytrium dendrobatidis]|uniref:peptidylprolyl isomerase n=1 Tax=Batrachochytrium dendrobatidis (strain JEL423) TaxID=403673 RepID=A0A177WCQ4_BATDL|nr:hypothetical protein BDEG_21583 [Batrachochytrium dendrobatidis JEL423]
MPPTAVTLKHASQTVITQHSQTIAPVLVTITGIVKDERFQEAQVLAQSILAKYPRLVTLKIEGDDPFAYQVKLAQLKKKYSRVIDSLYPGCIIEVSSHGIMTVEEFVTKAKDQYGVEILQPAAVYKTMSDTAHNELLRSKKTDSRLVSMQIKVSGVSVGQILIQLFHTVCPKTVAHFLNFVKTPAKSGFTYNGCKFDRLVQNGWIETRDIEPLHKSTEAEECIADENFVIKHDRRGVVSMVNSGPNTNRSAFMITFKAMPFFDYKYVAIGHLIDGDKVLDALEIVPTLFEKPEVDIEIEGCCLFEN